MEFLLDTEINLGARSTAMWAPVPRDRQPEITFPPAIPFRVLLSDSPPERPSECRGEQGDEVSWSAIEFDIEQDPAIEEK